MAHRDREADDRASLAPPAESIPPLPIAPRTTSVAPPSLGRASAHTSTNATAAGAATPARSRRDPAALLAITIAVVAAVDFTIPLVPWASIPLSGILTALFVPWAIVATRETAAAQEAASDESETRAAAWRKLAFHFANIALALAFLAAKWFTLVEALTGSRAAELGPYRNYTVALAVLMVAGATLRGGRLARLVAANADHPARLMAGSFGFASIVGAFLLALPVSLHDPTQVSLVDSLYIAVSAVCVTGASPVNIAQTYTEAGQAIIVGLVQIGGLGIMVITAAVTILAGRKLGVKGSAVLAEMVDSRSLRDVRRTVAMIVTYTLMFEIIDAGLLYLQFEGDAELHGASSPRWAAVFHAIAAFCNAGFSIFDDGLVPYVGRPGVCATIGVLVIAGGLGFPVMHELLFRTTYVLGRRRAPRLTLNTRVALATSAMLLAGAAVAYLVLENGASFTPLGVLERLNAAVFQSVSARSAGYNVIDVGQMRPASLLLTCFAMFVGGGSGSIAGGIKVTTLAVLFAAFRAELRGQAPRLFDRALPDGVIRRAMGVSFLASLLVLVVWFLLLVIEDKEPPLELAFETVSAFSTTGMSTGLTSRLGPAAKIVLVATMFIGRIALSRRRLRWRRARVPPTMRSQKSA